MFKRNKSFVCSVCGYDDLPSPLYKNGVPDVSLICACCGFQPGYGDEVEGYTFESYREKWIIEGAEWFDIKKKPKEWDLNKQLDRVK